MNVDLFNEMKHQQQAVEEMAKFLDRLDITGEYKVLFLGLVRRRGLLNITKYESELVDIASNGCDVIKLLLMQKHSGIDVIHLFSQCADLKKRVEVYVLIEREGKHNKDLESLLNARYHPNLFDATGVDYE